jgi:hypothetical protein
MATSGPPLSRRAAAVIAAVMALSAVAVVADRRRVRTGELTVRGEAPGALVTVRRGGTVVVAPTRDRLFTLAAGDYEVSLDGAPGGLRVVPGRVKVERGARAVVRVERGPGPAPTP